MPDLTGEVEPDVPSEQSEVRGGASFILSEAIPALLPEDELTTHMDKGSLVRVLEDWCPPFSGYHLYYPSRRQPSPAFSLVLQALRLDAKSRRWAFDASALLFAE